MNNYQDRWRSQRNTLSERLVTHSIQENQCPRCQDLEDQLNKKEDLIQQLRSYQHMLNEQLQGSTHDDTYVQSLQRERQQQQIVEQKLRTRIDQLQQELKIKDQKLHEEGIQGQKLSQHNMDLKRSLLDLEMKSEMSMRQLSHSYNDEEKQNTLRQQQDVIEIIEKDYQQLQQQYDDLLQSSQKVRKFINSLVKLVVSCHPNGYYQEEPSLKEIWDWLKNILEEFRVLKSRE